MTKICKLYLNKIHAANRHSVANLENVYFTEKCLLQLFLFSGEKIRSADLVKTSTSQTATLSIQNASPNDKHQVSSSTSNRPIAKEPSPKTATR